MSEEFARVLILNLERRLRFAKSESLKEALKAHISVIKETMLELGHKL